MKDPSALPAQLDLLGHPDATANQEVLDKPDKMDPKDHLEMLERTANLELQDSPEIKDLLESPEPEVVLSLPGSNHCLQVPATTVLLLAQLLAISRLLSVHISRASPPESLAQPRVLLV